MHSMNITTCDVTNPIFAYRNITCPISTLSYFMRQHSTFMTPKVISPEIIPKTNSNMKAIRTFHGLALSPGQREGRRFRFTKYIKYIDPIIPRLKMETSVRSRGMASHSPRSCLLQIITRVTPTTANNTEKVSSVP